MGLKYETLEALSEILAVIDADLKGWDANKTRHPSILDCHRLFPCPSALIMNTTPEQILDLEDALDFQRCARLHNYLVAYAYMARKRSAWRRTSNISGLQVSMSPTYKQHYDNSNLGNKQWSCHNIHLQSNNLRTRTPDMSCLPEKQPWSTLSLTNFVLVTENTSPLPRLQ
jgi:hypothetical protein